MEKDSNLKLITLLPVCEINKIFKNHVKIGINLTKEVKNLYTKNYKTLIRGN